MGWYSESIQVSQLVVGIQTGRNSTLPRKSCEMVTIADRYSLK
jgi:hypothetical protein